MTCNDQCETFKVVLKLSIIIPTKNGGTRFRQVLQAVLNQEVPWAYDFLVVDSGSTDGTVEYILSRDVKLHRIDPEVFGHGRTRNLAISLVKGDFIVLLTQDALPSSRYWLANLVGAVQQRDDIAAAFGKQLPCREADPYTARDLIAHFNKFLKWPSVLRLDDPERYQSDQSYRRVLHFFSNSNSCIRRSVWEKFPFPDVNYAEDQMWARTIIENGYAKAYSDEAAVYHSHQYSVLDSGRRAFDESMALSSAFGFLPCSTVASAFIETVLRTRYDWSYSRSLRKTREHLFWVLRSPIHNLSQQLGFYLGGKSEKLPDWLVRRISLDRSIKEGRDGRVRS